MNSTANKVADETEDREKAQFDVVDDVEPRLESPGKREIRGVFKWGVERRGIIPVPIDQRVDPQFTKTFFIWLSANCNILSFSQGTLGPAIFGLSLRDSSLVILFINMICIIPPAYLATFGPKLGLRQMVQARYSFGYFGTTVPSILNLTTGLGFNILNCILGGSTLSSVTGGSLSWNVGIVIIALLSLFLSFCGYKILNLYERIAWFPILVVYIVALGLGGHHLREAPSSSTETASAGAVLSLAASTAGFVITYSPIMSDYTAYLVPEVSSFKIFIYTYLGLFLPIVLIQILGAAFIAAVPAVPAWSTAYGEHGDVGALLNAILSPAGGFGKFLTVLLSLSVTANIAPTIYSFCISFQVFLPWLSGVPRYAFSLLATAIMTPLAIVGAHRFYDTLINFTGLIGYWASSFAAVVVAEHLWFRRGRFSEYDLSVWNAPRRLPSGVAALSACLLAFGLVIPAMNQVWFQGPFARRIGGGGGDMGFEIAFFATGVFYLPLRMVEKKLLGR